MEIVRKKLRKLITTERLIRNKVFYALVPGVHYVAHNF